MMAAVVQIQSAPSPVLVLATGNKPKPASIWALRLRRSSSDGRLKSSLLPAAWVVPASPSSTAQPKFSMRVASNAKQAYVCRDCGYIYNERIPFDKKPDTYFCPVCGAPKRRFRPYQPAVSKDANDLDVRKARKAQIQRDEAIGKSLPIAIVIGAAALAGLYFYLNSAY